ncbi:hypothetical protein ACN27G_15105 [Plantactinospora sp. WMMB334]|uniref:hypothetical protein n=1 Tax=Plantactinospora sp. WMMB334 TaxID=3404119 RepID=UPI003B9571E1
MRARHLHLVTYSECAIQQPRLAVEAPATAPDLYEPVTAEAALNSSCGNLLTTLGLAELHPEHATRISATPAPRISFV